MEGWREMGVTANSGDARDRIQTNSFNVSCFIGLTLESCKFYVFIKQDKYFKVHPKTLLNSSVSFNIFWWGLWGSPYTVLSHLQIVTVLILLFQFGFLFISFSCPSVVARTSNTMLSKSGESGQPCLIPDLRGKAFSFSPSMMLAMGLSYMVFLC